jgi:TonB family protein
MGHQASAQNNTAKQNPYDHDEVVEFADQQPEYPGGHDSMTQFIQAQLKYPPAAMEKNVQGTVYVRCKIHWDGEVTDVTITKDIGYGCGEAARQVVEKMPLWRPARMNGKAVTSMVSIPINFVIKKDDAGIMPPPILVITDSSAMRAKMDEIVEFADQQPEFPGGYGEMEKYIQKHLKYPKKALKNKVEGTVLCKLIVHYDGRISDVVITKDIGYGCGEEAKELFEKMPRWNPGKMNHKNVTTYANIPIKFTLK